MIQKDFEKIKKRYNAFWNRENDTPILQLTTLKDAPKAKSTTVLTKLVDRWEDFEYVINNYKATLENTYFGGDSFPNFFPNLGPDILGAICGADIEYGEDTSWAKHKDFEWDTLKDIKFDENNSWWKKISKLTKMAVDDSKGDYCVQIADLHPGFDGLVSLRGPQKMCFDIIEQPKSLQKFNYQVLEVFKSVYENLRRITSKLNMGTTNWLNVWSDKKWYVTSCDFSCLIGNDDFEEHIMPEVREELKYFDGSIWHLDGIDCARHLDILLKETKINGIQWVNSDFSKTASDYIGLAKKVQDAGKTFQMQIYPKDVKNFIENLKPQGLFLQVHTKNESEAKEVEEYVNRYYKK